MFVLSDVVFTKIMSYNEVSNY